MWILFSNEKGGGFASIVAKDANGIPSGKEPDAILSVRFRRKEDADKLFPMHAYVETPSGDYAGRVFASRRDVADVLAREALNIDYSNFKSSLPKADKAIYDACMAGWGVFGKLQPGGPYGDGLRGRGQGSLFDDHVRTRSPEGRAYDWPDYGSSARYAPGIPTGGTAPRRDPFCDACGMRVGADHLVGGICIGCRAEAAEAAEAAGENEGLTFGGASDGECWSCGSMEIDLPDGFHFSDHGLCPDCSADFGPLDDEQAAELRRDFFGL